MLTRQPQHTAIVSGYWRNRRMRACYLPHSTTPMDLSGNGRHCTDTASTLQSDLAGPGRAWNTSGATAATSRIRLPQAALNSLNGVTWIASVYATAVNDCTIVHTDSNEGGSGDFGMSLRTSTGVLQALYPGVAVLATGPTLSTGRWYTVGLRILAGTGIVCHFAVDGVITAGASLDSTSPGNSGGATPVIGYQNPSTRLWAGRIALFAAFDTMLSDNEFAALTINPWKMFVDPLESMARKFDSAYVAAAAGTFQNIVGRPFSLAGAHGLAGD